MISRLLTIQNLKYIAVIPELGMTPYKYRAISPLSISGNGGPGTCQEITTPGKNPYRFNGKSSSLPETNRDHLQLSPRENVIIITSTIMRRLCDSGIKLKLPIVKLINSLFFLRMKLCP